MAGSSRVAMMARHRSHNHSSVASRQTTLGEIMLSSVRVTLASMLRASCCLLLLCGGSSCLGGAGASVETQAEADGDPTCEEGADTDPCAGVLRKEDLIGDDLIWGFRYARDYSAFHELTMKIYKSSQNYPHAATIQILHSGSTTATVQYLCAMIKPFAACMHHRGARELWLEYNATKGPIFHELVRQFPSVFRSAEPLVGFTHRAIVDLTQTHSGCL
jgi:hypothetical protein